MCSRAFNLYLTLIISQAVILGGDLVVAEHHRKILHRLLAVKGGDDAVFLGFGKNSPCLSGLRPIQLWAVVRPSSRTLPVGRIETSWVLTG